MQRDKDSGQNLYAGFEYFPNVLYNRPKLAECVGCFVYRLLCVSCLQEFLKVFRELYQVRREFNGDDVRQPSHFLPGFIETALGVSQRLLINIGQHKTNLTRVLREFIHVLSKLIQQRNVFCCAAPHQQRNGCCLFSGIVEFGKIFSDFAEQDIGRFQMPFGIE